MVKQTRSNDWGFPRWRSYGSGRGAEQVRLCDREGCSEPGDRPAPKSPNRPRQDERRIVWNDGGFPRGRSYGSGRGAEQVRLCDREGCSEPGDRPAPKSPNSPERWYFCERHAAEYNRNWNYFEGLSAEEAAARESDERRDAGGFNGTKF